MKKFRVLVFLSLLSVFVLAAITAFAGKSPDVIEWSNGFPSGEHFNLNIHGKNADYACNETPGGGSVFVPEYGDSEIQIIQNKRSSLSELYVIDPCSFSPDSDPAKVQLPKGEYQVYARILAKPKKDDANRSVILYPKLVEACNENITANVSFENFTDCTDSTLVGLGVVTSNGAFNLSMAEFERATGKSRAVEITDMFKWSGYACNETFDIDGDGEITINDTTDLNGDNVTNEVDLDIYLSSNCALFGNTWIFDIADLVVYGWDYKNTGAKLLQVRFYPVATTEFI